MIRGVGVTGLVVAAQCIAGLVLLEACGDSKHGSNDGTATGSGGSSSQGGTAGTSNSGGSTSSTTSGSGGAGGSGTSGSGGSGESSASSGSGGTSGVGASGGSGGDAGSGGAGVGGTGGSGGDGGSGGSAATGGSGGDGGTAGSGGGGGTGGTNPCEGISECEVAGTTCDDDTLVTCTADDDGCLIEERTDCFPQPCEDTGTAACANRGDSCDAPLVVSAPLALHGKDFGAEFTNTLTLGGSDCVYVSGSGREMVLQIDLQAGEAVSVRELSLVQIALSITSACDADAPCLASINGIYSSEYYGIHYRATEASTVFAIVDLIDGTYGEYNVLIDFPESLGVVAAGDPIPEVSATSSDGLAHEIRLIEFSEAVQVSGTIDTGGTAGSVDWALVDALGNVAANFSTYGDDTFGPFSVPAGEYRVFVTYGYPSGTVTVAMSTE